MLYVKCSVGVWYQLKCYPQKKKSWLESPFTSIIWIRSAWHEIIFHKITQDGKLWPILFFGGWAVSTFKIMECYCLWKQCWMFEICWVNYILCSSMREDGGCMLGRKPPCSFLFSSYRPETTIFKIPLVRFNQTNLLKGWESVVDRNGT